WRQVAPPSSLVHRTRSPNSSLRTNLWIARKRDCIASASKLPAFLGAEGTAPQVQPPSWLLTTRSPFTATAVEPPVAASSVNRPRPAFTQLRPLLLRKRPGSSPAPKGTRAASRQPSPAPGLRCTTKARLG